jgi:hypothetical protein
VSWTETVEGKEVSDSKTLAPQSQGKREKAHKEELNKLWKILPQKEKKILMKLVDNMKETSKLVTLTKPTLEKANNLLTSLNLKDLLTDPNSLVNQGQGKTISKVFNNADLRQYALLKEADKLLPKESALSTLHWWSKLPQWMASKELLPTDDVLKDIASVGKVPLSALKAAVDSGPRWPKLRNLGNSHPKILALQALIEGFELPKKFLEAWDHQLMQQVLNPPKDDARSTGTLTPPPSPRAAVAAPKGTAPIPPPKREVWVEDLTALPESKDKGKKAQTGKGEKRYKLTQKGQQEEIASIFDGIESSD